jgi:hypothetical protein
MNSHVKTHASRFGFHVCDVETYRRLKRLHAWYWQTARDFHRWWRWQRKLPHNRRGSEPVYCRLFVEDRPWFKQRRSHGQDAIRRYPKTLVDRSVIAWFQAAKTPHAEPPTPLDDVALQQIEQLHAAVAGWFGRSGK